MILAPRSVMITISVHFTSQSDCSILGKATRICNQSYVCVFQGGDPDRVSVRPSDWLPHTLSYLGPLVGHGSRFIGRALLSTNNERIHRLLCISALLLCL